MKIGITSDCSSALEYSSLDTKIKIARTTIHFGEEELVDGIDITASEFYKRLAEEDIIPSTSAPTPKELVRCAEEWRDEGCTDVIHFPISFGLSKYGENLQMVAEDYVDNINYHVFNCETGCAMEGYIAHYAEILADEGKTVEEIFAACEKLKKNSMTYFVVDDLKYLVKNGRLNAASGLIGSLMRIKPILVLGRPGGTIDPLEKVRTTSKALARAAELVNEQIKDAKETIVVVQYTLDESLAEQLEEVVKAQIPNATKIVRCSVPPTIGCHIGRAVGLSYIILDDLEAKNKLILTK